MDIDKDLGARMPGDHLQPVTDIRMEPGEHLGGAGGDRLLQGSECMSCGEKAFPTRTFCPACGGRDLMTISLPAEGTLYSFSVVHVSSSRATPYAIGYVDLANGVRVLAGLQGEPGQLQIDAPVRLVVDGNEWSFAPVMENGDA